MQILVNNAGAARSAPFRKTDGALWQAMLAVNLTGTYLCCRAALPGMLDAGFGRIVNVASTAGLTGYAYVTAYCAAKHGVIGLTRALALETARSAVTVNAVCPGYTDTDMVHQAVANIVAKTGKSEERGARGADRAQPPATPGASGGGGQRRAVAVPAGIRGGDRAEHLDLGRGGDVRSAAAPVDLEARVTDEHHQALKVWLRLLACTNRIEAQIRARLRAEFGITLARFDLLAQLERSADGLKMSELSKRLMVSGGNVTGLTDELEKEGLVVREDDPADRRACTVKLTPAGRTLFARMAAVHEQWVIELLDAG